MWTKMRRWAAEEARCTRVCTRGCGYWSGRGPALCACLATQRVSQHGSLALVSHVDPVSTYQMWNSSPHVWSATLDTDSIYNYLKHLLLALSHMGSSICVLIQKFKNQKKLFKKKNKWKGYHKIYAVFELMPFQNYHTGIQPPCHILSPKSFLCSTIINIVLDKIVQISADINEKLNCFRLKYFLTLSDMSLINEILER